MNRLVTATREATEQHGESIGRKAAAGWIVALRGDLGAGKTTWTRGLVRGVGSTARVHSPTFALLNEYAGGRFPVFHLDLYRLTGPDDIAAAGLEEIWQSDRGLVVIEWIERWSGDWPPAGLGRKPMLGITLNTRDESEREICVDDFGTGILL